MKNMFLCEKCNYKTDRKRDYEIHLSCQKHKINSESLKKQYMCVECNVYFSDKSTINRHFNSLQHSNNRITSNINKINKVVNLIKDNRFLNKKLLKYKPEKGESNEIFLLRMDKEKKDLETKQELIIQMVKNKEIKIKEDQKEHIGKKIIFATNYYKIEYIKK